MISFLLVPLLTLLATLLHPTNASAAPSPVSHISHHLSNRSPHPLTDPSTIRRSTAQVAAFLLAHNTVRIKHHAKHLKWSVPLAEKAEQWADACNFKHTNGVLSDEPYGENIVAATGHFPIKDAVATFVQDAGQYNPAKPVYNHFTQVVWKSTTELGCAVSTCNGIFPGRGPATLYVCLYNPAGNVIGEIAQNVQV